jgi:transglutaminase-like putative cysteine protease
VIAGVAARLTVAQNLRANVCPGLYPLPARSMLVALHHVTRYQYERPVSLGPQIVRLRPAPPCRAAVTSYSLVVEPGRHSLHWQQDPHGNCLARVLLPEPAAEFAVTVDLVVVLKPTNPFDFLLEPYAARWPFAFPGELRQELVAFLEPQPAGARLQELLHAIPRAEHDTVDFLVTLNRRLQSMIRYVARAEPGVQAPEETLAAAAGSCRDSAWLLVQLLRQLGLPARFVSGYLVQLRADAASSKGAAGPQSDSVSLHAWAEVYLPGAGWIGLDPTSGLLCGEGHVPLAATPHFRSAAPVSGSVEPSEVRFSFAMSIKRIGEDAAAATNSSAA